MTTQTELTKQTQEEATERHTLSATYYNAGGKWKAALMLSNQGPNEMPVQITLYNLCGEQFDLLPLTFKAHEVKTIDLDEHVPSSEFHKGSLQVTYQGRQLELGGVLMLTKPNQGLSFDEELIETKYSASNRLEGLWWTNQNNAKLKLAVSNNSDNCIIATVKINGVQPVQLEPQKISLHAHQTQVLSLQEIVGENAESLAEIGSISISHDGANGVVLARGFMQNNAVGYSNVIEFTDPAKLKSSKIDAVGLRVGKLDGRRLAQGVVARNIGTTAVNLNGFLSYAKTNGSGEIDLPVLTLEPGEIRKLDIDLLDINKQDIVASGLHFEHTGDPGQVIISAQSVSRDGKHNFRVPMRDAALASSTGLYPFTLADNQNAIVYLQNVSESSRDYKVQIDLDNGDSYVWGMKPLRAGRVTKFDLRRLRDEQVPDVSGKTIPLEVKAGKFLWSICGSGKDQTIIGRIEQVDLARGFSSTAACGACCPDSFVNASMGPFYITGYIGDTTQLSVYIEDEDCYGSPRLPYPAYGGVYFGSLDSSVATVGIYSGLATAQELVVLQLTGYLNGYSYRNCAAEAPNEEYCCEQTTIPFTCYSQCDVLPPTVTSITSISSTKNPVTNQAPASGSYNTTNTSTTFANESTSDLMVAFQSTSTAITITADGVNPSTLASQLRWKIDRDPTDTVASGTPTLSSQTGAQITLTPTVAGNFRLICYYDNNSNSSYDAGEELKVLLLSIVKISANSNDCTISQNANFQDGSSEPNEFGVLAGSLPMALSCEFLIEGGGANKKIGTNKIHFGNVGNLTGDTAKVNYSTSGIATENPGSSFPVVDSPLDPTGGDTPFRSNSLASPSNASGGGVTIALTSYDAPGFGPFATVHPSTNNIWASTEGGYDFTEFIAGYSDSFQRTYIVVGKANWTIRYVGNRNSSGIWTNSNSGMTIQGVNQSDANFTLTLSNGSPQSGDDAGIQVLGLNYVDHRSVVYS